MTVESETQDINSKHNESTRALTAPQLFLKSTLLSIVFAGLLLLITAFFVGIYALRQISIFTQETNTNISQLYNLVTTSINSEPIHTNNKKTFLILGVDSVSNKPNSPELTDTMILASLDLETAEVNTLSLPRDLWSADYQTRINALYEYGKERNPKSPQEFPTQVLSDILQLDIHHTIVLSLSQLAELIDMVGGIEVYVPESFTDTEFPREDVDINAVDQAELYETISFEEGTQLMDGKTTLKYIRSRKSANLDQGTDTARSERQQAVILSLITKLQSRKVLFDPASLAQLYNYFSENFADQIPITELISTGYKLYPNIDSVSFTGNSLSIYPKDENGVITNPPLYKYQGQWVYEIIDAEVFANEVQSKLGITQ